MRHPKGRYTITLIGCLFSFLGFGRDIYWDAHCLKAYDHCMKLQIDSGQQSLQLAMQADPENLMPIMLQGYLEFLEVYVTEDPRLFQHFAPKQQQRIRELGMGDRENPYSLFAQAESHLHLTLLNLRFQDLIGAVKQLKRSYKLHHKNNQRFPDFLPSQKSVAVLDIILGSIPEQYQWGMSLLNLKGDLEEGIKKLDSLTNLSEEDFIFKDETILTSAMLKFHLLRQSDEAWTLLIQHGIPRKGYLLDHYIAAHIAIHSGKVEQAMEIINSRPKGEAYIDFTYLAYLKGLAGMYLKVPEAKEDFLFFIEQTQGQSNIKAAWQKIAWMALIQGNEAEYIQAMDKVIKEGQAKIDADKQALMEAESKHPPCPALLDARILYDGGFYEEAISALEKSGDCPSDQVYETEKYYRQGRILQALEDKTAALQAYLAAVESGWGLNRYFPYNACLQLGYLYKEQGFEEEAKIYFQKVLDSPDHEYKFGLDQKARAALNQ